MKTLLKEKLWWYIIKNLPELMFELQEGYQVAAYLNDKVEEICLQHLTAEYGPSKFNFIRETLEDEFPAEYAELDKSGLLTCEILNMMESCNDLFEAFSFSHATEDNRLLRYAVIAELHDYLLK